MLPTPPVSTPPAVRALRILVWLQVAVIVAGAVLGLALAGFSATGLSAEGESASWAGLGVFVGLVLAAVCCVGATALVVPSLLLRDGRRASKTGALITLAVVELAVAAVALLGTVTAIGNAGIGSGVLGLLVVAWFTVVAVLGLQPASRAWAAARS